MDLQFISVKAGSALRPTDADAITYLGMLFLAGTSDAPDQLHLFLALSAPSGGGNLIIPGMFVLIFLGGGDNPVLFHLKSYI